MTAQFSVDRKWSTLEILIKGLLQTIGAVTLLCALVLQPATADEPKQEKPPAPDWRGIFQMHYTQRVKQFHEQNEQLENVVLVGDSLTEGFDVAKFFPGRRILNRGIGADVIGNALAADDKRGVLKRLDESFFDVAATDAFLLIGINDLGDNHSPETVAAGYREILDRVKKHSPALRVHIQSLLPTRSNFAKHKANILDVNQRLQKLAQEFGYDYIDLHSLMKDDQGELKQELTADGLHINAEGYKIWQAEVIKTMKW